MKHVDILIVFHSSVLDKKDAVHVANRLNELLPSNTFDVKFTHHDIPHPYEINTFNQNRVYEYAVIFAAIESILDSIRDKQINEYYL